MAEAAPEESASNLSFFSYAEWLIAQAIGSMWRAMNGVLLVLGVLVVGAWAFNPEIGKAVDNNWTGLPRWIAGAVFGAWFLVDSIEVNRKALNYHYGKRVEAEGELTELRAAPMPNIVFERARPANGLVGRLGDAQRYDAYFIRAEFENRRRSSPPTTSLERPHVRIRYYRDKETDGLPFALVRDGRIFESPERSNLQNPSNGMRSASEVALSEIRVGQSMTVDLLVRANGAADARTWSDEGGSIGQAVFTPGVYVTVVEIEGDNIRETMVQRLRIELPIDPSSLPSLEPISPQ